MTIEYSHQPTWTQVERLEARIKELEAKRHPSGVDMDRWFKGWIANDAEEEARKILAHIDKMETRIKELEMHLENARARIEELKHQLVIVKEERELWRKAFASESGLTAPKKTGLASYWRARTEQLEVRVKELEAQLAVGAILAHDHQTWHPKEEAK